MKSNEVRSNFLAGEKFAGVTAPAGITLLFWRTVGRMEKKKRNSSPPLSFVLFSFSDS